MPAAAALVLHRGGGSSPPSSSCACSNATHTEPRLAFALALVLGGALGNVIDRVLLGHVVGLLYFHYRGFAWPAFNVADSAISVALPC